MTFVTDFSSFRLLPFDSPGRLVVMMKPFMFNAITISATLISPQASRWLALNLQTHLGGAMDSKNIKERFQSADDLLIAHLRALGSPEDAQSGSTGTVVMIEQGRLVSSWGGDYLSVYMPDKLDSARSDLHKMFYLECIPD